LKPEDDCSGCQLLHFYVTEPGKHTVGSGRSVLVLALFQVIDESIDEYTTAIQEFELFLNGSPR
jgi:hypothetical protein